MPVNGLVTMTPSSIASTGTGNSSSIGTNGSVTFSSCATLSLNGVFTSSYDNYMISFRWQPASSSVSALDMRLRASGTDNSSSLYTTQYLSAEATGLFAFRVTTTASTTRWYAANTINTRRDGATFYVFGPYLSQATAIRGTSIYSLTSGSLYEFGGTHNSTTAYDGFTIYHDNSSTLTGLITVYGFNQ